MRFNVFYDVDGASGGAPAPAPATATVAPQGNNPAPSYTTQETPTPSSAGPSEHVESDNYGGEKGGGWKIVVDPVSGLREIQNVEPKKEEKPANQEMQIPPQAQSTNVAPPVSTPNAAPPAPANQTPDIGAISNLLNSIAGNNAANTPVAPAIAPYSDNEFVVALQMKQVDEARVPPQYRQQYEAAKQQRATLGTQTPATPPANQQILNNQTAQQMQLYREIGETAKQLAAMETGVTAEELAAAEYSDDANLIAKVDAYNTAVKWHETNLATNIQLKAAQERTAAETAKAQQAAVMRDIQAEVQKMQASEPNFAKIDAFMNERYKSLPLTEALPIAQVYANIAQNNPLTPQQAQILKKYYEDSRLDFYAQNANLGSLPKPVGKPAAVEVPGTGTNGKPAAPDYKALRGMDSDGKQAFIAKLFGIK